MARKMSTSGTQNESRCSRSHNVPWNEQINDHASHTLDTGVNLPEITGEKLHFAKYLLHSDQHIDDKLPLAILTGIS